MGSNLPPGCSFYDKDMPWNNEEYTYEIIECSLSSGMLVLRLRWEEKTPDNERYFPEYVSIDLEELDTLINKKIK